MLQNPSWQDTIKGWKAAQTTENLPSRQQMIRAVARTIQILDTKIKQHADAIDNLYGKHRMDSKNQDIVDAILVLQKEMAKLYAAKQSLAKHRLVLAKDSVKFNVVQQQPNMPAPAVTPTPIIQKPSLMQAIKQKIVLAAAAAGVPWVEEDHKRDHGEFAKKEGGDDKKDDEKHNINMKDDFQIDPKTGFDVKHTEVVVNVDMSNEYVKRDVDRYVQAWNNIPQWRRAHIKKFELVGGKNLEGAIAEYKFYNQTVVLRQNINDDPAPLLEHEIGHDQFHRYSTQERDAFVTGISGLGPLTSYNKDHLRRQESHKENAERFRKNFLKLSELQKKLDVNPNDADAKAYSEIKATYAESIENWGLKDEDFRNGTSDKFIQDYYDGTYYMYENEQHSEFLAIYYGNESDRPYNKTVYNKLKKVYEEINNIGTK